MPKRTFSIEVVSSHFIFRRANLRWVPIDWEEQLPSGKAVDEVVPTSALIDNRSLSEISNNGRYLLSMTNLLVETVSRDRTFEIPFYFHHPEILIDEGVARHPVTVTIDASVVYRVTLLDNIAKPVKSGTLTLFLRAMNITLNPQVGEDGSILFLGDPTVYLFDLSDEFGLEILPA